MMFVYLTDGPKSLRRTGAVLTGLGFISARPRTPPAHPNSRKSGANRGPVSAASWARLSRPYGRDFRLIGSLANPIVSSHADTKGLYRNPCRRWRLSSLFAAVLFHQLFEFRVATPTLKAVPLKNKTQSELPHGFFAAAAFAIGFKACSAESLSRRRRGSEYRRRLGDIEHHATGYAGELVTLLAGQVDIVSRSHAWAPTTDFISPLPLPETTHQGLARGMPMPGNDASAFQFSSSTAAAFAWVAALHCEGHAGGQDGIVPNLLEAMAA